jgi:hypothetical protein
MGTEALGVEPGEWEEVFRRVAEETAFHDATTRESHP